MVVIDSGMRLRQRGPGDLGREVKAMRVLCDAENQCVMIVADEYGELRKDGRGREYVYLPLPICRIPVGYGRSFQDAETLARGIARRMED